MKYAAIAAIAVLIAAPLQAGNEDKNTTIVLDILADSKADALQRSMMGLELGGPPPQQRANRDGDKATYTYSQDGLNVTVWTYKDQVYVIKISDPNHKDNRMDLAAVQSHLGADGKKVINGIEYEDDQTRLTVKSSTINYNVELVDLALYEEAGGTLGW